MTNTTLPAFVPGDWVEVTFRPHRYKTPFGQVAEVNGTTHSVRLESGEKTALHGNYLKPVGPDDDTIRYVVTDLSLKRPAGTAGPEHPGSPWQTGVYPTFSAADAFYGTATPYEQYEYTDEVGAHVRAAKERSLNIVRAGIRSALKATLDLRDEEIGHLPFSHKQGCDCGCSPGFNIRPAVLDAEDIFVSGHIVHCTFGSEELEEIGGR